MDYVSAVGDNRALFQLIRNNGAKQPGGSETICEYSAGIIHSLGR